MLTLRARTAASENNMNPISPPLFLAIVFLHFLAQNHVGSLAALWTNASLDNSVAAAKTAVYRADWSAAGRWMGRAWWANPLWDWRCLGNGRVRVPASANHALSLLPFELSAQGASFTLITTVSFSRTSSRAPFFLKRVAAGFGLGRRGPLNDYRSAAVYAKSQLHAVIYANGKVSIGFKTSKDALPWNQKPVLLTLKGKRVKNSVVLTLTARQFNNRVSVSSTVPLNQVTGVFALVSEGLGRRAEEPFAVNVNFNKFFVTGTMLKRYNGRMYGAVMWSQYTISQSVLRLQAQLAPIDKSVPVSLIIRASKGGKPIAIKTSWSDKLSRTARFTIYKWNSKRSWPYEVKVIISGQLHMWSGVIRKEPPATSFFKIAAFSCDEGYMFPQSGMVNQVSKQNPDLLYFAGDQMYPPTAGFSHEQYASIPVAVLDFLRRWYLFGWTWRKLLSSRPSIIIPDDHDVFQGNLWGDGGRAIKWPKGKRWETGGYVMPAPWLAAVEKCHTGHFPPPRANFTTPLGIRPYFTSLVYGGISMAVLEDRKFKTPPLAFPISKRGLGIGGHLLGFKQEAFLKKWAKEWKGAIMKVAFSQTILANVATHGNSNLYRIKRDYDAGGWPVAARNRAVKLLGQAKALSLHGDQHLGMLLRQGVKKHDDAGVAFMVPGTANGFPRAWWPGVDNPKQLGNKKFTGKYIDGVGHPVTVLAVGNPEPGSVLLDTKADPPIRTGRAKGSGYGLVVLNRRTKTAMFHLYRVGKNFDQFRGFPRKVYIGGK